VKPCSFVEQLEKFLCFFLQKLKDGPTLLLSTPFLHAQAFFNPDNARNSVTLCTVTEKLSKIIIVFVYFFFHKNDWFVVYATISRRNYTFSFTAKFVRRFMIMSLKIGPNVDLLNALCAWTTLVYLMRRSPLQCY